MLLIPILFICSVDSCQIINQLGNMEAESISVWLPLFLVMVLCSLFTFKLSTVSANILTNQQDVLLQLVPSQM